MAAGCHYVCAWGPGCVRVHDITDLTWSRENPESANLPVGAWDETYVATTAHDGETIDEALWFAIFLAHVDEHELRNVLAVTSPRYAEHVERRLADSEQLSDEVVDE